jgi:NADH-quinone oxidoreductase subunit H
MTVAGTILALLLAATGTLVLGLAAKWVDRKVTARLQWRVGPPWYQPAVDCLKLLGKETVVPAAARGSGFLLAPLIGLAGAAIAVTLLWVMNLRSQVGFVGDAIVVLYLFTLPSLATMLGAAASGSPHAGVGARREMKLLLSYELPLIVVLLVAVVHTGGSFRLSQIVAAQQAGSAVALSVSGALALVVAVFCVQAKLGLVPFDQAEAETELMAGVYTEYSGAPLAAVFLTRALLLAALPLLVITLFLGGLRADGWGVALAALKFVILLVVITLLRNTNPRVRIDQTVWFFWYLLTPVALLALVLAWLGRQWGVHWL